MGVMTVPMPGESSGSESPENGVLVARILVGALGAFLATWWAITAADALDWGRRRESLAGLGIALIGLSFLVWSLA